MIYGYARVSTDGRNVIAQAAKSVRPSAPPGRVVFSQP
jgi:hypothetical protein